MFYLTAAHLRELDRLMLQWSRELASREAVDLSRMNRLPSIAARTFLQASASQDEGQNQRTALMDLLVRQAHGEAAHSAGLGLNESESLKLRELERGRFANYEVRPGRSLDVRLFGRLLRQRMDVLRTRTESRHHSSLVWQRSVGTLVVRTLVAVQSRPYYLQYCLTESGVELVGQINFLRLIGIADQTLLDEARGGDEADCASVIEELVAELEDWVGRLPDDLMRGP